MKTAKLTLPLLALFVLLTSASFTLESHVTRAHENITVVEPGSVAPPMQAVKMNFFQKVYYKIFLKKNAVVNPERADKLANTSLLLGIGGVVFLLAGLAIPYVILGSIPLAIAAMITGSSAIRNGTSRVGKAKTGKGLGLGILIAFGVLLIAAAVFIAAWGGFWYNG